MLQSFRLAQAMKMKIHLTNMLCMVDMYHIHIHLDTEPYYMERKKKFYGINFWFAI